jgi:hypothetical protein
MAEQRRAGQRGAGHPDNGDGDDSNERSGERTAS